MKAVLVKRHGPPHSLVLEDIAPLVPGAGQVLVSVHAAAVNFPDTLIIENKYQFKPALPFSPCSEVAGTVKQVGDGVAGYEIGDRVIAVCQWGGYAEEVLTNVEGLVHLPEGVDMEAGAALVVAYGTSHYALKERANIQPGETLLVLGAAGGTGLSAIEVGKLLGARVIAAASTEEKLALCKSHGADDTINYATEDLRERLKTITGGRGVDVVYDPVGGSYSELALRSIAWKGRYLVIGFAAGEIPRPALNLVLLKGCSIVGVFYGAFSNTEPKRYDTLMRELLSWVKEGWIRPVVTARYPLERAAEALQVVVDRRATGKILLTTELGRAQRQFDPTQFPR